MAQKPETNFQRGKMKPDDEQVMRTYVADILCIEPQHVATYLYEGGIISYEDKLAIIKKPRRCERAEELYGILLDRGTNAFDGFIKALVKARYIQLASKLKTMRDNVRYEKGQVPKPSKIPVVSFVPIPSARAEPKKKEEPIYKAPRETPSIVAQETSFDATASHSLQLLAAERPEPVGDDLLKSPQPEVSNNFDSLPSSSIPSEPEETNEQDESSTVLYESLKTTFDEIGKQVDQFLPLLNNLRPDLLEGQRLQIEKELNIHMQNLTDEKTKADESARGEKKFLNRDMVILVVQMNRVVSFLSGALQELAQSFRDNDSKYKESLGQMQNEIKALQKEVDRKNTQLAELERERSAERQGFMTDVRAALEEQRRQMLKDLKNEKKQDRELREKEQRDRNEERELRAQDREMIESDRARIESERKKIEADKQTIEMNKQEVQRMKEEMERKKREEEESRANAKDLEESKGACKQKQEASSRDVFIPRTHKTSLPVRGKAVPRQSRERKN